jgi:hypothetical protein
MIETVNYVGYEVAKTCSYILVGIIAFMIGWKMCSDEMSAEGKEK